jgi:hypothetical protein
MHAYSQKTRSNILLKGAAFLITLLHICYLLMFLRLLPASPDSILPILLSFLTCAFFVSAAPFDSSQFQEVNTTTVGWVPESGGRGTVGLLTSCALAMGLCVWTALHLNVEPISLHEGNEDLEPPPNYVGKLVWAFITLIAPEMVSTVALHQYLITKKYMAMVNRDGVLGQNIGMLQAYFATMGGIARVKVEDGKIRPSHTVYGPFGEGDMRHLPPLGFDKLLEQECIEMIRQFSVYEMGVRSKQDGLAKLIVCGQATWNLIQFFGRILQKLPITPLELHTALYIFNLTVMYAVWWSKPVDIGRPILLCLMQDYNPRPMVPVVDPASHPPGHLVAFVIKYGDERPRDNNNDSDSGEYHRPTISEAGEQLRKVLISVQEMKGIIENREDEPEETMEDPSFKALYSAVDALMHLRELHISWIRKLKITPEVDIIARELFAGT